MVCPHGSAMPNSKSGKFTLGNYLVTNEKLVFSKVVPSNEQLRISNMVNFNADFGLICRCALVSQ